jgi:hypothetical protein
MICHAWHMMKAIVEVSITATIVLGTAAAAFIIYNGMHAAIFNPSVPHDVLWRALFGP